MALSPEDEEIASQYRKMVSMGLADGAVIQKMAIDDIPQHIQDAVLAGEDKTPPEKKIEGSERGVSDSHNNRSANSFWEEEVVEDEETIEEVVVDDNEEVLEEDGDFEEEIFEEEEVIEESQFFNPKDDEDSDNEVGSDGQEEQLETAGSTTRSNSNADDGSVPGMDVENQQQLQGYRTQPNATSFVRRPPEKALPSPSSCWYWVICLIFVGLIGAGAGVGYWLTTRPGDDVSILKVSSRTDAPTAAPSVSVSTKFDAVQGECNFDGIANPNPIDQCLCSGEITMIEPDIRDRYFYNLEYFIPDFFEDYNDEINSCSPRNQALVWISSGDDSQITKTQRTQKFALAAFYASLGGSEWKNNDNWLVDEDVCAWYGVSCAQGYVTELVLDSNNLLGMVSHIQQNLNPRKTCFSHRRVLHSNFAPSSRRN